MSIFKKFAPPLVAVALVAVMGVSLLTNMRTAYAAVETNIAGAMQDQQAAMIVANPDQIPRSAGIASLATPTPEDTSVLGAAMAIGILVAAMTLLATNHSASRVGFGFQVMRERYGTWRGILGSVLPGLRPSLRP